MHRKLAGIAMVMVGCQTSGPKRIETAPSIFSSESMGEFSFTQDESKWVHESMIKLDLSHGRQHDDQTFHSVEGRLQCQQAGRLRSCYVRTRLSKRPYLSETVRTNPELSQRLLKFFSDKRDDLKEQSLIMANVRCDFKGPKIPPFDKTDIKCHLDQPRLAHEAVFEDFVAEKLFFALKGERPSGTKVIATGDLWCEQDRCRVRSRDMTPSPAPVRLSSFDINAPTLAPQASADLLEKLQSAQEEAWSVERETPSETPSDPALASKQFKGPVRCESTLHAIKSGTMRRYYCRVTLQQ